MPRLGAGRSPTRSRNGAAANGSSSSAAGPSNSRGRASNTYGGNSANKRRQLQQQQQQQRVNGRQRAHEEEEEEDEEEDEEEGEEEEEEGDVDPGPSGAAPSEDEADEDEAAGDESLRVKKRTKLPVSEAVIKVLRSIGRPEVDRKVNELVRLALFSEYKRQPLRRDEITKKVLGKTASRAFPYVFNRAQAILRELFCYELVELRAKGTENEQLATQTARAAPVSPPKGARGATQAGSKRSREEVTAQQGDGEGTSTLQGNSSRSYVLRSILPGVMIQAMNESGTGIAASTAEGEEEEEAGDSLLDWNKADGQLGSMGLTFLILSLILLNGRSLPDDQFRALLNRLNLTKATSLPSTLRPDSLAVPANHTQSYTQSSRRSRNSAAGDSTTDTLSHPSTLQTFLNQLIKQGYLETVKTSLGTSGAANSTSASSSSSSRRRPRNNADGDPATYDPIEWRWGPRAEVEIGEVAVANFVSDVYVDCEVAVDGRAEGDVDEEEEDEDADDSVPGPSVSNRRQSQGQTSRGRRATQTQPSSTGGTSVLKKERQSQLLRREIERAAGSQLLL